MRIDPDDDCFVNLDLYWDYIPSCTLSEEAKRFYKSLNHLTLESSHGIFVGYSPINLVLYLGADGIDRFIEAGRIDWLSYLD
jgi:hypothetical protein